ncbi:MAG: DUF2279 domain-containing protein [Bacteroidota bacterium]
MRTFTLVFLLFTCSTAICRDSLMVNDGFHQIEGSSWRKTTSGAMVAGFLGLSLWWGFDAWWQGNSEPFHLIHEGWFHDYSLGIDKIGHFYTAYFYFRTFRNIMLWGGHDRSTALWWGVGGTALFSLCVEVGDGFTIWGFSFDDLTANTLGLCYGVLQTEVPYMQNFNFKWSYVPRSATERITQITSNYDSHTYWLAINVNGLLPESAKSYWPEFLQLAVGYGVGENSTRREAAIGLDFNLEVFSPPGRDLLLLQKTVNMFHFPAPAIKFTQGKEPSYHLFHTR